MTPPLKQPGTDKGRRIERISHNDPHPSLAQIEEAARELGMILCTELPVGAGFVVCVYQYDGADFTYLSTGDRNDTIKALDELIGRLKQQREADGTRH